MSRLAIFVFACLAITITWAEGTSCGQEPPSRKLGLGIKNDPDFWQDRGITASRPERSEQTERPSCPPEYKGPDHPAERRKPMFGSCWEGYAFGAAIVVGLLGAIYGLVAGFRYLNIAAEEREKRGRLNLAVQQREEEGKRLELKRDELALLREGAEEGEEVEYTFRSSSGTRRGTIRRPPATP